MSDDIRAWPRAIEPGGSRERSQLEPLGRAESPLVDGSRPAGSVVTDEGTTVAFLAGHRRERIDVIADRWVTMLVGADGYAGVAGRDDLRRSCRDNVARMLELLADAVEQGGFVDRSRHDPAYDAARGIGRRGARQDLPLDDVLRSLRLGGQLIWDDLVECGHTKLDASAAWEIGRHLWRVVDETSAQVSMSYRRLERALVRADEQRRAELWEGVLGGRARELGFADEASRLLDLPLDADFLVVKAPALEVRGAEARLLPHATAWVCRSRDVVGLIALREDDPTEALTALQQIARHDGVPLGVSSVVRGLTDAGEGFRQAGLALHAQGSTSGSACFDERLPEAILLGSPDVVTRLIERWLEPVLVLPAAEADALTATVTAWVEAGGLVTRAAAAVPCHRNTVLNRLRRISELIGHPLIDEAVPVELDLAIRGWRMGLRA